MISKQTDPSFTLKVVDIDFTLTFTDDGEALDSYIGYDFSSGGLDELIQVFIKKFSLDSADIHLIRSTNDSGVKFNYIQFYDNQTLLDDFIKFAEIFKMKYEIISSDSILDEELPGHLFIRGIGRNITNEELMKQFEPFGKIELCKIILNDYGHPTGYGFINYHTKTNAKKAIKALNGIQVNGGTLFVNFHVSKRDRLRELQIKRDVTFNSVYIRGLPATTTKELLKQLFEKFGEIESVVLPVGKSGAAKGYGFVNFKYHTDAKGSLSLNNQSLKLTEQDEDEFTILVDKAEHRKERSQYESLSSHFNYSPIPSSPSMYHLSPPPPSLHPVQIQQSQQPFLPPPPPPLSPNGPGGGYYFPYPIALPNQKMTSIPMQTGGNSNYVTLPMPQFIMTSDSNLISTSTGLPIAGPEYQDSNLYVCHLPLEMGDGELKAMFETFGSIISCKVIRWQEDEVKKANNTDNDENDGNTGSDADDEHEDVPVVGQSKGFGFVSYQSPLDASQALVAMNGYSMGTSVIKVSFAQRKENRHGSKYVQNHLRGFYKSLGVKD